MNILVVEDDQETAAYIQKGLKEEGHSIDLAFEGHEGFLLARSGSYDVIVLDRMIPELDGLSFVKLLRQSGIGTAVLFLTALGRLEDRVEGLHAGADDYLVKPFAFSELYARICSLARRSTLNSGEERESVLECQDLKMDLLAREVFRGGREIPLHATEFRLLEYLLRHKGKVVTRTMLLENVWGFYFDPKTNVVETHISRLRAKVDRGFTKELIKTIRGSGYKLA